MFARTKRLLLRPGWIEDAPALARTIGEERIVRNLSSVPWPYGLADAETFLAKDRDTPLPTFLIVRRTLGAPELIGALGFRATPPGEIEFGYWIASDCWNRGYATEAGRAALALARDSLRLCRIVSGHFLDNPASGRVLEKLGFAPSGEVTPCPSRARGEDVPVMRFALDLRGVGCGCHAPEQIAA